MRKKLLFIYNVHAGKELIKNKLAGILDIFAKAGYEITAYPTQRSKDCLLYTSRETGFCSGIENYSRHLSGLEPGTPPWTLIDYFPDDFLIMIDESHKTVPQIRGMYFGDQNRKKTLVEYGFRLPSARDNRPLNFGEFESKINQLLFVSATPGEYEAEKDVYKRQGYV